MSKRGAANYLTQDNFDDDEEDEQASGVFTAASNDVIQNRVIKRGRRRINDKEGADSTTKNTFRSFTFGMGSTATSDSSTSFKIPSFNFNTSAFETGSVLATASKTTTASSSTSMETSSDTTVTATEVGPEKDADVTGGKRSDEVKETAEDVAENGYVSAMIKLNEEMLSWVTQHVKESPDCILTPIFVDYDKYIKEIEEKWLDTSEKTAGQEQPMKANSSPVGSPKMPTLSSSSSTNTTTPVFSFGAATSNINFGLAKKSDEPTNEGKSDNSNSQSEEQPKKPAFTFGSINFGSTNQSSAALGTPTPTFSFFGKTDKPAGQDKGQATTDESANQKSADSSTVKAAAPTSQLTFGFFGKADKPTDQDKWVSTSDESANQKNSDSSPVKAAVPTNQSGFSFAGITPFSFGSTTSTFNSGFGQGFFSKPASEHAPATGSGETAAGDEDGEYEPPKVEVVETTEEGSFYSTRCKLYYKKGDKFEERGLGFLHLKPNGSKTQLIIRTDTALGNILLNINVEKVMPVSRQGSNNVTIICIPNPPIDTKNTSSKPIPMLIRVKNATEADELYKQLTGCQAKMP